MSAYANIFFTTICECICQINIQISGVHSRSAVRFGQALPGYLITTPPSVCVSAVLVSLAVWIQNQNKIKNKMSRCVKYQELGAGVGVGFCHSCHSVKMRQKTLDFLEHTWGPSHNVQTNTSLVSDHTYQWGPSVK